MEAPLLQVPRPFQIDFPGFEINSRDTVVDVGCGEGAVCVHAGNMGAEVIGLDIEPELVERTTLAMQRTCARSFRGIVSSCDPIPLPDSLASVVVATEVLEHVKQPERLFRELARIGRPGSRYLISVPDPASEAIMKLVAPSWYWQAPLHVHVYEHGELERLAQRSGLVVESRQSAGFHWAMRWIFRMAIGMEHKYAPFPPHSIFDHWDATVDALIQTPQGKAVLEALDRLLPKSQVLLARRPASSSFRAIVGSWLKSHLRDGKLRLGRHELHWKIRRSIAA